MNNIEWKDGAVCYANSSQWIAPLNDGMIEDSLTYTDFQLNEIRTGDYVEASELDTEQKYNDVVEVFGLFGFESDSISGRRGLSTGEFDLLMVRLEGYTNVNFCSDCKRKLTYAQIMAIGKLKRLIKEQSPLVQSYIDELENNQSSRVSKVNRDLEGQMKDKINSTIEKRGSNYGKFKDGAQIMQELKNVMRSTANWDKLTPSQREALEMIQHKIGRILNGNPSYVDSWHDIQGYAKLVEDELNGVAK